MLAWIAKTRFWARVGRVHGAIYRWSGGRIGMYAGGLSHLLLTTVGRRSGAERTVPLTFLRDDDRLVLVASNGGAERHPAWWLNLEAAPNARVRVGSEEFAVRAAAATGQERDRLWARLTEYNPFYRRYATITARRIPVVVLTREPGGS